MGAPSASHNDQWYSESKIFCIICLGRDGNLRWAHDKDVLGKQMRECAMLSRNNALVIRLPANDDLVAANCFYHHNCWVDLQRSKNKKAPFIPVYDPVATSEIVDVMLTV